MAGLLSPQAGGFFAAPRIGNLITSADVLRSKKPGSYFGGSISSYTPSVLERAEQKITGLLSHVLPQKEAAKLARKATSFANDFTPAGDAVTAAQAGSDFRQGDILSGLGNTAIAAIGVVPGVGDVAAKGLKKGIRAYHGSPHDFDKFSLSKIGTGEGAQSYGHGLYFAENEKVAREYRSALAGGPVLEGRDPLASLAPSAQQRAKQTLARAMKVGLQGDDAIRWAMETIHKTPYDPSSKRMSNDAINGLGELLTKPWEINRGKMYEVNISADPNSLLDWDAPLSGQSPQVLSALQNLGIDPVKHTAISDGSRAYGISRMLQGDEETAVRAFLDQGVPGIRYLDQGSRQAGEGSRNFVIFDDSIIDILNKY